MTTQPPTSTAAAARPLDELAQKAAQRIQENPGMPPQARAMLSRVVGGSYVRTRLQEIMERKRPVGATGAWGAAVAKPDSTLG